jgi:hypothetical protein
MNMRKQLNQAPVPTPLPSSQVSTKASLISTSKKVNSGSSSQPVMEDDITYKKIIENKPPKADVLEYLRHRIEELKVEV